MASALSLNSSAVLHSLLSSNTKQARNPWPSNLLVPRHSSAASTLAFVRRTNRNSASSSSKKNAKSLSPNYDTGEGDDVDVDTFEALFSTRGEDLKSEDATIRGYQDGDDISEEDLEKHQRELEMASGFDDDDDQDVEVLISTHGDFSNDNGSEEEDDGEEEAEGERPVKLKNWQLRGLAKPLETGRRKTRVSITKGKMNLPGDWNCRLCQHLNFQRRDLCQRCGEPRPGERGDPYGSFGGRGGSSFGFTGPDFRPGDWYCTAGNCGAHNFATRSSCFKCGLSKDESSGGTDADMSRSRGYSSTSRSGWKSGDWICTRSGCNMHNFASRTKCYRCRAPRESGSKSSFR